LRFCGATMLYKKTFMRIRRCPCNFVGVLAML